MKCLKLLYRTCGRCVLLPKTLEIPVWYDRVSDALFRGGYADVWKGEHCGRAVAVKVIRLYSTSDLRKIIGVRFDFAVFLRAFTNGTPSRSSVRKL